MRRQYQIYPGYLLSRAYKTDENESVVKEFQKACTACGIKSSLIATLLAAVTRTKCLGAWHPGIVMASAMHQVYSCQEYTRSVEMAQVAGIVSELLQMKRVNFNILNILISPCICRDLYYGVYGKY